MKILYSPTRRASKMTRDNATTTVQIFVPPMTERYANPNARNIVPTSRMSPKGLYSMAVYTREIRASIRASSFTRRSVSSRSGGKRV
jgi:hypothetical protein